ncbi:methionine aminopeptidase 2 [Pyrenophora seminiperda CCB06]|uniref:Methionine aminopeptidase 2 n=1 Tax=Pyrenophora seminiperda CCB06 TaxID=1302712 RepID=A0A3M7MG63_9PLEO|nr:methionine aminopeptidase 2 [Pyrenophora seminiperda CCB06]
MGSCMLPTTYIVHQQHSQNPMNNIEIQAWGPSLRKITVKDPMSAAASGLLEGMLEGQNEDGDDDDDDDEKTGVDMKANDGAKKKRKRNKKKSKKAPVAQQTSPPRVPLATLFNNQPYPEGQTVDYTVKDDNIQRTTAEELRHLAAVRDMDDDFLKDYRKAAEVHRQVRHYAQTIAKPGVSMTRLAEEIDDGVRALTGHDGLETGDGLKAGLAFPTGLCLNHVGAHWTPNAGAKEVFLKHDDVLKVDFGVHVNGRIVDSAFTVAANPVYDNLLAAVKAATNAGLEQAGIDARIAQISETIQEVMESYEVELNGKTIPVKAVRNITGHNILRYRIHGDKQVPFIKTKSNQRMEEGDIFAIETFGSTGKAYLNEDVGVYGYGRNHDMTTAVLHQSSAKSLLKTIDANFGTLVFARRQLERLPGVDKYHLAMRTLVNSGLVESYAPLVDVPGSYVAQFEHTVLLRPNCKEIISRGDDY